MHDINRGSLAKTDLSGCNPHVCIVSKAVYPADTRFVGKKYCVKIKISMEPVYCAEGNGATGSKLVLVRFLSKNKTSRCTESTLP